MKIDLIAGARPNFMKIAPIIDAIKSSAAEIKYRLVHTGQHYDKSMSGSFFEQLGIPEPDVNLAAGGGTQAEQTAKIMMGYEALLARSPADICLVVGDVTSTMACSIVAKKAGMTVIHVEAGIRSFDLTMPEEINRMVTDAITDYFFTTSETANKNLLKQGVREDQIFFVGNTMIDTLMKHRSNFRRPDLWESVGLKEKEYLVITLHRPANVDGEDSLRSYIKEITKHSNGIPVVFPCHPRTRKVLEKIDDLDDHLILSEPLGYLEFNYLVEKSLAVITDSGGITEETTVMGVPCLTLRDNTERPETITVGTNELIGTDPKAIAPAMKRIFQNQWKKGSIPEYWDGKTGIRIVGELLKIHEG